MPAKILLPRELANIRVVPVKEVYMPQEFIDGKLYYGFSHNKKNYLINSIAVLPFEKMKEVGIVPKIRSPFLSHFPVALLRNDAFSKQSFDIRELLDSIIRYIHEYIYLADQRYYSVLAAWIMATYVFRIFNSFPYLHINAAKGSGKSTLMSLLRPIAFNGISITQVTPAVLFRLVDNDQCTLFIDEAENLGKEKDNGSLLEVLRAGYNKDGIIRRVDTNSKAFDVKSYSAYCPKMVASINSIENVLHDRFIRIHIVRKEKSDRKSNYIPEKESKFQEDTRNKLYLWGLTMADRIFKAYGESNKWQDRLDNYVPRIIDLWTPLFIIADLIREDKGTDIYLDTFIRLADENSVSRISEDEDDSENLVIAKALNEIVENGGEVSRDGDTHVFTTEYVYTEMIGKINFTRDKSVLTHKIKQLGFTVKNKYVNLKSVRCYFINKVLLDEYIRRYSDIIDPDAVDFEL